MYEVFFSLGGCETLSCSLKKGPFEVINEQITEKNV
jgi:hypothetical protein